LPRNEKLNVRSPDNVFAADGSRETQILMALSAFMIMLLILLSALVSPAPGNGANPRRPRGDDASTGMPRQ
jgi:hypothetical protein